MKTSLTLANNLNCSIFDVNNQEVDEIIMLINFYIVLGNTKDTKQVSKGKSNDTRIKVNDKTATGGWF